MKSVDRFPPWPFFGDDEIEAVQFVLRSGNVNYWTGQLGHRFEVELADTFGVRHAVAMANGSVALDAILAALSIAPGDEVIVSPRSFVASASCILLRGATPVFVDIDPDSQNMTVENVAAAITPKSRAIIAVHLAGWPCDMDGLLNLAESHGLTLIEDCAQAHGATLHGRPVGGLGHVAAFSFCQDKIITTGGEGGAVLTNDETLWEKIWSHKDHGKHPGIMTDHRHHQQGYRWVHGSPGTNYRMTEMQAAIGIRQLEKLPAWLEARNKNARFLHELFCRVPSLRIAEPPNHVYHAYYKYYVFVRLERLGTSWSRDRILTELDARALPYRTGVCPEIYLERAFSNLDLPVSNANPLKVARDLGVTSLMLPIHPTLQETHLEEMAEGLITILRHAER